MDSKKKQMLLGGVAALLVVLALVLGFRESIFGSGPPPEPVSAADTAALDQNVGQPSPPDDAPVPPRGSGRLAKPPAGE